MFCDYSPQIQDSFDIISRAIEGCSHVIHSASLRPTKKVLNKSDEDDFTRKSVDGALALLSACRTNKIKRFILTSCSVAINGIYILSKFIDYVYLPVTVVRVLTI